MSHTHYFDTHGELVVQRYKQGVHLVRPDAAADSASKRSLMNLYQLPTPIFFMGIGDAVIDGNESSAELVGAPSTRDLKGKTLKDFYDRQTEQLLSANNSSIMRSQSMKIIEEAGTRWDDILFRYLAFKFPVFYEHKVIGLMGCCINIAGESITNFSTAFSALSATGLLNVYHHPVKNISGVHLSQREQAVVQQLIRGNTSKKIAAKLKLSTRTVESYIENIKFKAHCRTKSELIDLFIDELMVPLS